MRILGLVTVVALAAAACGGSSDDDAVSSEFCSAAAQFASDQSVLSVSSFDASFFDRLDAQFEEMLELAPEDLRDDLEVLRSGYGEAQSLYEQFGSDGSDDAFLAALGGLDNGALLDSSDAIASHVFVECDPAIVAATTTTTPGGFSFDRSDPATGVINIMDAFATDQATAECIFDAWGDVANVPPEQLTAELLNFPICGTSIFQMITGDPRFTGRDDG